MLLVRQSESKSVFYLRYRCYREVSSSSDAKKKLKQSKDQSTSDNDEFLEERQLSNH